MKLFYLYLSPIALLVTVLFITNAVGAQGANSALDAGSSESSDGPSLTRTAGQQDGPVFVLLFDGLGLNVMQTPDGEIDQERFPNFASFAQDGVWFSNATSNNWATCNSIPTILTGKAVRIETEHRRCFQREGFLETNLLSRLESDYKVITSSAGLSYCFSKEFTCLGGSTLIGQHPVMFPLHLMEDLAIFLFPQFTGIAGIVNENFYLSHRWSVLQFDEFVESIGSGNAEDQFFYIHSALPHEPFVYDATGKTGDPVALDSSLGAEDIYESYREQARFVDLMLGSFIDRLKNEGIYEKATVIVTADHGFRASTTDLAARIPLMIKSPALDPGRSDVDYQHIDFSNTLFDVLGLPPAEESDGVSAFDQRPDRVKVFYQIGSQYIFDQEEGDWELSADSN